MLANLTKSICFLFFNLNMKLRPVFKRLDQRFIPFFGVVFTISRSKIKNKKFLVKNIYFVQNHNNLCEPFIKFTS